MKVICSLILVIGLARSTFSQQAKDYLCLDTTVVLHYTDYRGKPFTLQFEKSFQYGSDTVCYFTRRYDGAAEGVTLYYTYNGQNLTVGSYIVNDDFSGTSELDTKILIVGPNEFVDTFYSESFDMSTTDFVQTNSILEEYTNKEGVVFKNVLKVDQFNQTDNFHYITLFGLGIGIISKGGREMEFVRKEILN